MKGRHRGVRTTQNVKGGVKIRHVAAAIRDPTVVLDEAEDVAMVVTNLNPPTMIRIIQVSDGSARRIPDI